MTTFKWNYAGFRELRTMPSAMAELERVAAEIAAEAGEGFEAKPAEVARGRVRGRVAIITTTPAAMRRQARDHVLERLL